MKGIEASKILRNQYINSQDDAIQYDEIGKPSETKKSQVEKLKFNNKFTLISKSNDLDGEQEEKESQNENENSQDKQNDQHGYRLKKVRSSK